MHGERTSTKIWSCVLTLPTAERVQVDGEGRAAEEEEVTARVEMATRKAWTTAKRSWALSKTAINRVGGRGRGSSDGHLPVGNGSRGDMGPIKAQGHPREVMESSAESHFIIPDAASKANTRRNGHPSGRPKFTKKYKLREKYSLAQPSQVERC